MQCVAGGLGVPGPRRPPGLRRGHTVNDIVQGLSISSCCAVFLHWAGLQAPGGTLAAIYVTLRRYLPTPPHRVCARARRLKQ